MGMPEEARAGGHLQNRAYHCGDLRSAASGLVYRARQPQYATSRDGGDRDALRLGLLQRRLPYWTEVAGKPRLIVPYALDTNDFKFATNLGWMSGEDFLAYLKSAFDQLYREGEHEPKMMSIGLHARLTGRPRRANALARFMDYVQGDDRVWICRRVEIARHWIAHHPAGLSQSR